MAINYRPIDWKPGMSIGPTNFNKMDKSIKDACDGVDRHTDTISTLQSTLSETQSDVGELKTKATNTDIALAEIKLLGWTTPEECPIKNELNGNVFTQRVGRVELGSLGWEYRGGIRQGLFSYANLDYALKSDAELYCYEYKYGGTVIGAEGASADKQSYLYYQSGSSAKSLYIRDTRYTDIASFKQATKSKYLYYELSTPITKNVEGNEIEIGKEYSKVYPKGAYTIELPINCSFVLCMETSSSIGLSVFMGGTYNTGSQYGAIHTITKRSDVNASISGNVLTFSMEYPSYVGLKIF